MIRTILAVSACKACRFVLRLLKRGGTALPGKAALKLCPDILGRVAKGVEVFVITGTNGKTTTSRMLEHALVMNGEGVLANKSGANLLSGITAEFAANTDLLGRPLKKTAVIECDEGALKQAVPYLKPKVIIVTNLFRDQLDRYGEVMHTRAQIRTGLEAAPDAVLCLNADCSLTASLAEDVRGKDPEKVRFYGLDTPVGEQKESELSDAVRCIRCGAKYEYRYHTYAHLGSFYCPECGFTRPETDTGIESILELEQDHSTVSMRIGTKKYETVIALPAVYNIYNAAAAATAFEASGREAEVAVGSLESVASGFGRMESFRIGARKVQVILVKNPAGADQAVSFLSSVKGPFEAVLMLNDRTADGHDISWIWDVDYESLMKLENLKKVYTAGDRCEDLEVRLKYAAPDPGVLSKVQSVPDASSIADILEEGETQAFVLPNYTSLLEIREILSKRSGRGAFWEG
ncbi:MAG: DUF1727 domain-containing protein [Clostridia bacterium]|nr:DUF1727 domain-containing protein [Clostridia bacterium]